MKIFHSAILALAIGAASFTSAQARDSFSFGLNIGGGYPPPVYYAPPVTYYNPSVVYYSASPGYYANNYNSAPVVRYRYSDDGFRGCRRGGEEREHHGWGHEQGEHHGWNRHGWSRDHDDDDD